jgi:hypothetical protein
MILPCQHRKVAPLPSEQSWAMLREPVLHGHLRHDDPYERLRDEGRILAMALYLTRFSYTPETWARLTKET